MTFVLTPYVLTSAGAALLSLTVARIAWPRRAQPGGRPLVALMSACFLWAAATAVEYGAVDISTKIAGATAAYLGVLSTPVFFLLLALDYSRSQQWLTARRVALLFVVPLVTLALTVTNGWHGLIWPSFTPSPAGHNLIIYGHGPGFWVGVVIYSYGLMAIGTVLLIRAALQHPGIYRSQALALIAGGVTPWAGNLIYLLGWTPAGYEPTSLLVSVTGLMFTWGVFRFRLLDMTPVARSAILEMMNDAVFALDAQGRVLDVNAAAQRLLGAPAQEMIGRPAADLLAQWSGASMSFREGDETQTEIAIEDRAKLRYYSVRLSRLRDTRGAPAGSVMIVGDVTIFKAARDAVQRAALLEERERMARDLHDNLGGVLGFMNLQSQATRKFLADGNIVQADAHLARLTTVAQNAQKELRDFIVQLKAVPEVERSFFPLLASHLENFERDYGVSVQLTIAPGVAQRGFAPAVGAHLLNIIQEALHNAGKHADAARVWVAFAEQGAEAELTVADDGHGFDASQPIQENEHFGLSFIRERAQRAGGSVRIASTPGQGTQIVVRAPLRPEAAGGAA